MLYLVNFSSDRKSNISDRRPYGNLIEISWPFHSEPGTSKGVTELLSSLHILTINLLAFWTHLEDIFYLLLIYSEIIPELMSILSAIVHFSQSANFVASASYRQLQAQPHFITVPSGNIYENTRCSHQGVVIFLDYSERELLVNLRDARDQKYKCWNFMNVWQLCKWLRVW